MIFTYVSDVHLEYCKTEKDFDKILTLFISEFEEFPGTLLVAGDFCPVVHPRFESFWHSFFESCPYTQVLFIPGNHEYYGSTWEKVHNFLKAFEEKYVRFVFLNQECFGCDFFGATGWYPDTPDIHLLKNNLHDFDQIKSPNLTSLVVSHHDQVEEYLSTASYTLPSVCFFHHSPWRRGLQPKFRRDRLRCYYENNFLSTILRTQNSVRHIIHGHTHYTYSVPIFSTLSNGVLVSSNPFRSDNRSCPFSFVYHNLG